MSILKASASVREWEFQCEIINFTSYLNQNRIKHLLIAYSSFCPEKVSGSFSYMLFRYCRSVTISTVERGLLIIFEIFLLQNSIVQHIL